MAAWADEAFTLLVTRKTVTAEGLDSAQAIIDLYSNRTLEASGAIGTRDLGWLRQAVAWQAAWMLDQPGLSSRSSVTGVDQDSNRTTFVDERAVVLAPLAKRALRNLSWKRTRSINVQPFSETPDGRFLAPGEPYPEAWDDTEADAGAWQPLNTGG